MKIVMTFNFAFLRVSGQGKDNPKWQNLLESLFGFRAHFYAFFPPANPSFSYVWLKVQMSDPAFSELSPESSGVRRAKDVVFYLVFLKN